MMLIWCTVIYDSVHVVQREAVFFLFLYATPCYQKKLFSFIKLNPETLPNSKFNFISHILFGQIHIITIVSRTCRRIFVCYRLHGATRTFDFGYTTQTL